MLVASEIPLILSLHAKRFSDSDSLPSDFAPSITELSCSSTPRLLTSASQLRAVSSNSELVCMEFVRCSFFWSFVLLIVESRERTDDFWDPTTITLFSRYHQVYYKIQTFQGWKSITGQFYEGVSLTEPSKPLFRSKINCRNLTYAHKKLPQAEIVFEVVF